MTLEIDTEEAASVAILNYRKTQQALALCISKRAGMDANIAMLEARLSELEAALTTKKQDLVSQIESELKK